MVEGGGGARFTFEAFATVRVADELAREDLERDAATEPQVVRNVHLAHAAGTEQALDPVVSYLCSDHVWR